MFILSFSSSKFCQYVIITIKNVALERHHHHSFTIFYFLGGGNWGKLNQKFLSLRPRFEIIKVITHTTVKETKL